MNADPEESHIVRTITARSILTETTGFLAEAGFTHSLTPARNCTFGCSYCYVPTMGIYGGLKPEDWQQWGHHTTFKTNAAALLLRSVRADQRIYCSPLVDPYQPAEESQRLMREILNALIDQPPLVLVLQTRGPLILRDLDVLQALATRTRLRVSFSITTNRDEVRRWYEPHCAPIEERLETIRQLRRAGIETYATLAPILPCDPEELVRLGIEASGRSLIGDPLHVRQTKPLGATTRDAAFHIAGVRQHADWLEPKFQRQIVRQMQATAEAQGFTLEIGPKGFARLTQVD
jgi:DNA repair photolyase